MWGLEVDSSFPHQSHSPQLNYNPHIVGHSHQDGNRWQDLQRNYTQCTCTIVMCMYKQVQRSLLNTKATPTMWANCAHLHKGIIIIIKCQTILPTVRLGIRWSLKLRLKSQGEGLGIVWLKKKKTALQQYCKL